MSPRVLGGVALWVLAVLWLLLLAGSAILEPAEGRVPGTEGPRSAVLEPGGEAWRILLLSDLQNGVVYLGEIMERVRADPPVAVLVLGDIARDHDEAHISMAAREFQRHPSPSPLFAVPGNHDISGSEGRDAFVRFFGGTRFDLTVGDTRLLGVDNADGPLGADALADLETQLSDARARGQRVVLVAHRAVVNGPGGPTDERKAKLEEENRALLALVERYPVAMVLGGHHHFPMDEEQRGVRFVIVPASGDSSYDTGQTPVSFTWLVWDGSRFAIEHEEFYRSNHAQLVGAYQHVVLSHLAPFLGRHRWLAVASLLVALAALYVGTRLLFAAAGRNR